MDFGPHYGKESEMLDTFEMKVDGEVISVEAGSLAEAVSLAKANGAESVQVLYRISRQPQEFLAW